MAKSDGKVRIGIAFCLDNPEHKKAYEILQASDNKNQLIRRAIIAYDQNNDYLQQLPTREEMRVIVTSAVEHAMRHIQNLNQSEEKKAEQVPKGDQKDIDIEKLKKFL